MDKAVQVFAKERTKCLKSSCSQTDVCGVKMREASTQLGVCRKRSKGISKKGEKWTYDRLRDEILCSQDHLLDWLMEEKLIRSENACGVCNSPMKLVCVDDRIDGLKWECRRQIKGKRHKVECSIRKDSWFENSNLTMEEVVKYTYWWCRNLKQEAIAEEVGVSDHTAVDWDSFCRETCEVTLLEREEKIGGVGKVVQIDESKFGKRKYHRGHRVEGQWVFGGIEEESRKSFMVAVEKRNEDTLLPVIKRYIAEGSTIISDCWKAYVNLEKHGYVHECVNHSKEFVNADGFHTNKIEGHWRQAKVKLPSFGVRKHMFSSYL